MSTKVAELFAKLGVDNKQFVSGLAAAKKDLTGFKGGIVSTISQVTGLNIGMIGAAGVLSTVANSMKKAADDTAAYADQVRDLARLTGKSTEESSRLIQVADDLQVSYQSLTTSLKIASKQGIDTSIEGLMKLSEEYNALTPGVERAQFALQKFGRSGEDMMKILEAGPETIRNMSDAIAENLVLTSEQTQNARDYQIAMDNLEDTMAGLQVTLGNALIPAFTDFLTVMQKGIDSGILLVTMNDKIQLAYTETNLSVQKSSDSYRDYLDTITKVATNAGELKDAQGELILQMYDQQVATGEYNDVLNYMISEAGIATEAQWELERSAGAAAAAYAGLTPEIYAAYRGIADLEDIESQNALTMQNLSTWMKEYSTQLLFANASAGLNSEQQLLLAEKLGLIDNTTRTAMEALGGLKEEFDSGKIGAEGYIERVQDLDLAIKTLSDKDVTITVTTVYEEINRGRAEAATPGADMEGGNIGRGQSSGVVINATINNDMDAEELAERIARRQMGEQ